MRPSLPTLALGALALMGTASSSKPMPQDAPPIGRTVARISMFTAQPETMKRFYREVLGFELVSEGVVGDEAGADMIARAWNLQPGSRMHAIVLRAPRGNMMLQLTHVTGQTLDAVPRKPRAAPLAGDHYFTLYISDLDEAVRRMAPYGTPFHRGPMVMKSLDRNGTPYSVYEAVISDPDGTILIVVEDKNRGA